MKQFFRLLIPLSTIACSISLLAMEEKQYKPKSLVFTTALKLVKNKIDSSTAPTEIQEIIRILEDVDAGGYNKQEKKALYAAIDDPSLVINKELLTSILSKVLQNFDRRIADSLRSQPWDQALLDKYLLEAAIDSRDEKPIETLLALGTDPDSHAKENEKTPLYNAIRIFNVTGRDTTKIIGSLLKAGANVNHKVNKIPLIITAASAYPTWPNVRKKIIELLLSSGADINESDEYGKTALINVINKSDSEIAKMLLEKGANVNIRDKQGKTALDSAESYGNQDLINLLKDYQNKPTADS